MDWTNAIEDLVQRYSGQGSGTGAAPQSPHQDFQKVTQTAPQDVVARGIAQAFQSDQTPPFSEMVANLFSHSDLNQRAGLLNRLLSAAGPSMVSALPELRGLSSLSGSGPVTPQQAQQVKPGQVEQMAEYAQRQNPSVVHEVSDFYAQHPEVVKAIGGLAISIALHHMLRRG